MKTYGAQLFALLVTVISYSCGGASPSATDLLPVAVGNQWVYEEVGGTDPGTVTKTITETETFLDQNTYILTTTQTNSLVTKRSNWLVDDDRIVRLRQQRFNAADERLNYREYDPGFLRMSGALTTTGTELEEPHARSEFDADGGLLDKVNKSYTWTVEAEAEEVTVPAGTFSCVRVRRVDANVGEKTYWYAAGVGKVLERDNSEEERLTDYTVGGD